MTALALQASNPQAKEGCSPLQPSATHQTAAATPHAAGRDVAQALALPPGDPGRPRGLGLTPFNCLPLYARVAIERLDAAHNLRTAAQLDELLQAYATTYGLAVDLETCAAAHRICSRRFLCFVAFPGTDGPEA